MTIATLLLAKLLKLPRRMTGVVGGQRDVGVEMPDGVMLLTDHWHPEGHSGEAAADVPTILIRTPYGRRSQEIFARLLAERGYHVVVQSCRGTFGSGGRWEPLRNEKADGRATIEWILTQPWRTGPIVTMGGSYVGFTQWAVAADPPPELRAMALGITAASFRDSVIYPGGAFAFEGALLWLYQLEHQESGFLRVLWRMVRADRALAPAFAARPVGDGDKLAVGRRVDFYQDWLAHDRPGDPWWDAVECGGDVSQVPPSSMLTGWYDIFLPDQLDDFVALRRAGRDVRLTVGPWRHASPAILAATLRDALDWYRVVLSGAAAPPTGVRVFVMGDKRWLDLPDWPPPAEPERWFLHGDGRLAVEPPAAAPPRSYVYDPANPTPALGGRSLGMRTSGAKTQTARETRPDVLAYTSAPLGQDLTVIGPMTATLHLRSDTEHLDVFVRLCDVAPNGRSTNLSDGIRRLGPDDVAGSGDGTFTARLPLCPTANTFKRGHRLRLQISSAAHPLFARNPGTGEPLATATALRRSRHEVFSDPDHPSALELPVFGRAPVRDGSRATRIRPLTRREGH
jgi:putative CocE/NonD family hydrolase